MTKRAFLQPVSPRHARAADDGSQSLSPHGPASAGRSRGRVDPEGDADRFVIRPGDPLDALVAGPLPPESVARLERLEASSAMALARAGRMWLD